MKISVKPTDGPILDGSNKRLKIPWLKLTSSPKLMAAKDHQISQENDVMMTKRIVMMKTLSLMALHERRVTTKESKKNPKTSSETLLDGLSLKCMMVVKKNAKDKENDW